MLWAGVRIGVGILLVFLIGAIVVSPYVDLPLTTLSTQQAMLWLCNALMAWAVAGIRPISPGGEFAAYQRQRDPGIHEGGLLRVTCALLC